MTEHVVIMDWPDELTSLREAAHWYAGHDFYVFPCRENGKEPACSNGHRDATKDHAVIDRWWDENENYNIGCAPDRSGYFVLDVDPPVGAETLAALEKEHGELPDTLIFKTPRGGFHIWLKGKCATSVGTDKRGLGPKLDSRGYGGYVVLAPSRVVDPEKGIDGVYSLAKDCAIAAAPAWINDTLNRSREAHEAAADVKLDLAVNVDRARTLLRGYVERGDIAVSGSGGNDRTYQLACEVLSLGLSEAKSFEEMRPWNEACKPPWGGDDLKVIIGNAASYMQNDVGAWAVAPASETFKHIAGSQLVDERAETSGDAWRFGVYDAVADAALPPITYRDERKLWPDSPEKTVTQVIAPPKGLKTAFVMGELFALMLKGKARVKILALEGEYGVRTMRLKALAAHHNVPLADLRGRYEVVKIEGDGNV